MKKLIFILVFVINIIAFAVTVNIDTFNASSDNRVITISWNTNDESNVSAYDIERSNGQVFTKITNISAKGFASNYKFIDETALTIVKTDNNASQGKNDYSYRIKIIGKDNSSVYSNTINVTHSVSSIRKTWGMLKEMFR